MLKLLPVIPPLSVRISPILAVAVFLTSQVLSTGFVLAEDDDEASDQVISQMSVKFGIPASSRFYKEFKRDMHQAIQEEKVDARREERGEAPAEHKGDDGGKPDQKIAMALAVERPVITHYRAKFGIPLPKKDEVIIPFKPSREEMEEKIKQIEPYAMEQLEKAFTAPELPECPGARTEKTKVDDSRSDGEQAKSVVFDMLFLDSRDIQPNPDEQFGLRTVVRRYVPMKDDPDSLAAKFSGVTCLPYRLRIVGNNLYRHQGLDALRNYDKKPDGKGKIHEETAKFLAKGGY